MANGTETNEINSSRGNGMIESRAKNRAMQPGGKKYSHRGAAKSRRTVARKQAESRHGSRSIQEEGSVTERKQRTGVGVSARAR
jgi:hypothetical protein